MQLRLYPINRDLLLKTKCVNSRWNQAQIRIELETKHVIYQKLANFP